jgi:hypothetical protein
VPTAKVAVVAPAGTLTVAATEATPGLLLNSETTAPPVGAGPFSVTVPVDDVPPVTLAGVRPIEVGTGGRTVSAAVLVTPS